MRFGPEIRFLPVWRKLVVETGLVDGVEPASYRSYGQLALRRPPPRDRRGLYALMWIAEAHGLEGPGCRFRRPG